MSTPTHTGSPAELSSVSVGGVPSGPPNPDGSPWGRAHALLALVDQAVVSGCGFAFLVVLVRGMDLTDFGVFSTLWLGVLFINSFHMAYIVLPMLTDGVRHQGLDRARYFSALLISQHLFNVCACIAVLMAGFLASLLASPSPLTFPLLAAVVITYHAQEYYRRYFFCVGRPGRALLSDVVAYGGRFLPLPFLLASGDALTVDAALGVTAGAYSIATVLASALKADRFIRPDRVAWSAFSSAHWRSARYLLPSALLQWLSGNLHIAAASIVLGPASISVLRMGQTVVNVGNVYLQALENHAPSAISAEASLRGRSSAARLTVRLLVKSLVFVAPVGALALAFAPEVMALVFGDAARQYAYAIYWLVPTFFLAFVLVFVRALLRALDATRCWFRGYVVAASFAVVTFYPLQEAWGIHGVLLGMLSTYAVLTVYTAVAAIQESTRLHV